jgi:hypothetical protein
LSSAKAWAMPVSPSWASCSRMGWVSTSILLAS